VYRGPLTPLLISFPNSASWQSPSETGVTLRQSPPNSRYRNALLINSRGIRILRLKKSNSWYNERADRFDAYVHPKLHASRRGQAVLDREFRLLSLLLLLRLPLHFACLSQSPAMHVEAAESEKLCQNLPRTLVLAPSAVFLDELLKVYDLEFADANTSRLWVPQSARLPDFSLPDLRPGR
jgi:hypothetical protein